MSVFCWKPLTFIIKYSFPWTSFPLIGYNRWYLMDKKFLILLMNYCVCVRKKKKKTYYFLARRWSYRIRYGWYVRTENTFSNLFFTFFFNITTYKFFSCKIFFKFLPHSWYQFRWKISNRRRFLCCFLNLNKKIKKEN